MPIYFFHLRRGGWVIPDLEGTPLVSIDAARHAGVLDARELIIRILMTEEPLSLTDSIDIADENSVVLDTVTFRDALGFSEG
jgi:hypothetical protein